MASHVAAEVRMLLRRGCGVEAMTEVWGVAGETPVEVNAEITRMIREYNRDLPIESQMRVLDSEILQFIRVEEPEMPVLEWGEQV